MKKTVFSIRFILALAVVMFLGLTTRTWAAGTFPTNTYTQSFLTGGNSAPFSGSGSVASWISWYDSPGNNTPLVNDVNTPDPNAGPGAGSLMVDNTFTNGNQNLFFGTFSNLAPYDFSQQVDLAPFDTIAFDVYVKPINPNTSLVQQPSITTNSTNFGSLQVGVINPIPAATFFGSVTIPASASNGWVHLTMPINHAMGDQSHIAGIAFNYNNYNGYPTNDFVFWLGHLTMHYNPGQSNPPPKLLTFQRPAVGLNFTDTQVTGNQDNRYQVETATSTGYGFMDKPNVTYSWNLKQYPTNWYQQHLFIVAGRPGLYDQAADWNLANCIFITVQLDSNGFAFMQFRYKTNEPTGNGMIYNTSSNTAQGWPVEPICQLSTSNSPLGSWSVTFNNHTNVTFTAPHGETTNFVFDPASAALFADPATVILGAQPSSPNVIGKTVIYNSFSVTGNDSPFTDIFTNDLQLNTNWTVLANDPNGVVLVPRNAVYWLPWTLPDTGFGLQTNAILGNSNWLETAVLNQVQPNPTNRAALLGVDALPGANQGFYRLLKRNYTQLQVLWPGETNAPGTPTGKIGTPNPSSYNSFSDTIPVTVNGCDSTWHIVNVSGEQIYLYSQTVANSGVDTASSGGPLVNGTANLTITYITVTNTLNTVTAGDSLAKTNGVESITQGTSSVITIN
jgi:hypothetical protein